MQTFSFKIAQENIDLIKKEFDNFLINNDNQFVLYTYKILNSTITIYNSKKIVIQTKDYKELLHIFSKNKVLYWFFKNNIEQKNITTFTEEINEDKILSNVDYVIGSDEVGVGDLFGGLVVCSVSLNKQTYQIVKKMNINDSKKISDTKINELAVELSKVVSYSIVELSPRKYNNLIHEFNNSHILKTILHYDGFVSELNKKTNDTKNFLILDEFVSENKFNQYLQIAKLGNLKINLFSTKAESKYLCVAAASILARYHFLKKINQMSKTLRMEIPLGASNDYINETAKKIYERDGIEGLKKVAKEHFSNFKKAIS